MSKSLKASLMLGLAGCVYGAFLVIAKVASNNGYGRGDLIAGQYLIAALVFGIAVLVRYRNVHLATSQRLRLILIGAFGFGVNFCLYEAVAITSSSFAVTMLFQCIWIGIAFDSLVTRKLPTKPMIVAGVLVILGMPLATGLLDDGSTFTIAGILWGFGAAISYAGMLWTSAHFEVKVPPVVRTFYFALTQAVLASITSPQFYFSAMFDPGAWAYALPLSLCTGIIPVLIIMKNSPKVPVGISTIMLGMELPSTITLDTIFLHQPQSPMNIAGVLLICVGIIVANKDGIAESHAASLQSETERQPLATAERENPFEKENKGNIQP